MESDIREIKELELESGVTSIDSTARHKTFIAPR